MSSSPPSYIVDFSNNINTSSKKSFLERIKRIPLESRLNNILNYTKPHQILLVGNTGVGKSSYIEKMKNKPFRKEYTPSFKPSIHNINSSLTIMELPKSDDFYQTTAIEYEFCKKATKIIIMVSQDSYSSYEYIEKYFRKFNYLNIPFEILINKSDISIQIPGKIKEIETIISKFHSKEISYKMISVKSGLGFE